MKQRLAVLTAVCLAASSAAAERPNVLFIAIDDLRCDLGCFGATHAKTPHLDALAASGRLFSRHYVQVPTCGASRCGLLRGRYPTTAAHLGNDAIRDTHGDWAADSLPAVFKAGGYRTLSLGKVSHYPGNLTGQDWAVGPEELPAAWHRAWVPASPWTTPEGLMHGYARGAARQRGVSPPWQACAGPDEIYPDAWVARDAVATLRELAAERDRPWFFGVGFFKPHMPFAAPRRWFDLHDQNVPDPSPSLAAKPAADHYWYDGGEFRRNYGHEPGRDPETDPDYARLMRQAYAGCVSYMDAQLGRVLDALRDLGLEDNTVVVVWSDHGFLIGEHAMWGKHCLYELALRSPLMIRTPTLKKPGAACRAVVETVDVFPTLTDLCGLPGQSGSGRSLVPWLDNPAAPTAKPALGFWNGGRRTVRDDRWRLLITDDGTGRLTKPALFDHDSDPDELRDLAANHPDVVARLAAALPPVDESTGRGTAAQGAAGNRQSSEHR